MRYRVVFVLELGATRLRSIMRPWAWLTGAGCCSSFCNPLTASNFMDFDASPLDVRRQNRSNTRNNCFASCDPLVQSKRARPTVTCFGKHSSSRIEFFNMFRPSVAARLLQNNRLMMFGVNETGQVFFGARRLPDPRPGDPGRQLPSVGS